MGRLDKFGESAVRFIGGVLISHSTSDRNLTLNPMILEPVKLKPVILKTLKLELDPDSALKNLIREL